MPDNISNLWLDIIGAITAIGLFISLLVKRMAIIMDVGRKIFKSKSNSTVEEKTMASDEAKAAYRISKELKEEMKEFTTTTEQNAICGQHLSEQAAKLERALRKTKDEIIYAINGGSTVHKELATFKKELLNEISKIIE